MANEGPLPILGGACHPVDLMRWIAGEIVEVSAFGARRNIPEAPWDDTVIANLRFASGALGKCLVSCGAKAPYAMNLAYYGTRGSVVNDRLFLDGIPPRGGVHAAARPHPGRGPHLRRGAEPPPRLRRVRARPRPSTPSRGRAPWPSAAPWPESIEAGRPVPVTLDF